MQKIFFGLIAVASISCLHPAQASSVAKISALKSPAWVQQNEVKTRLETNSEINIGDRVITGDSGSVEMQLWSNVSLQLKANSEIEIWMENNAGETVPDKHPGIYVHNGRACIKYASQPDMENPFKININDALLVEIQWQGHVCILRQDSLSSVSLQEGSVQITHSVDPNIVILSERGTEFRIDDDGAYELLFPNTENSLPIAAENIPVAEKVAVVESSPTTNAEPAASVYTVYLFSTRSENVANQVNKKFQTAGHKTEILVSETDSVIRYRIVVTGFNSRQAAETFSSSIVGKLGIADTWIGKNKQ